MTTYQHLPGLPNGRIVPLSQIERREDQPRQTFDDKELDELADSIRDFGVLQPVVLQPHPDKEKAKAGIFRLVSGERRVRAAGRAGLTEIPATVLFITDARALEVALQENIQRQELKDWEEALAIDGLMKAWEAESGQPLSKREMSRRLGKSVSYVSNRLDALGYHPEVQAMMARHSHVLTSALHINEVAEPEVREQLILMVDEGASVTDVVSTIQTLETEKKVKTESNHAPDQETQERTQLSQTTTRSGGSSRGRTVTGGTTRREADELVLRAIGTIRAYEPHISDNARKQLQFLADEIRKEI